MSRLPALTPAQASRAPQTYCSDCADPLYAEDERQSFNLCPDCEAKRDHAEAQHWLADIDQAAGRAWACRRAS